MIYQFPYGHVNGEHIFLGTCLEKHSELPSEDARCQDLNQTIQKMACHSIEGFLRYNMV